MYKTLTCKQLFCVVHLSTAINTVIMFGKRHPLLYQYLRKKTVDLAPNRKIVELANILNAK